MHGMGSTVFVLVYFIYCWAVLTYTIKCGVMPNASIQLKIFYIQDTTK